MQGLFIKTTENRHQDIFWYWCMSVIFLSTKGVLEPLFYMKMLNFESNVLKTVTCHIFLLFLLNKTAVAKHLIWMIQKDPM